MKHFLIFGSHPALSEAEAEAVLGQRPSHVAGQTMAVYEHEAWEGARLQNRLAGITKLGDVVMQTSLAHPNLNPLADFTLSQHQQGKILYGFSVYGGTPEQRSRIEKLALPFKRLLQAGPYPVRWVTGKEGSLSPAAVDKLDLTNTGYDFVFGIVGTEIYVGRTTQVQDATAWSTRDYGRPFRDAKTGMLPPKLARLMVNLATGMESLKTLTLLDPFCGGGTVLMEAALLGVGHLIGSDIDARQVAGTEENTDWLIAQHLLEAGRKNDQRLLVSSAETVDTQLAPQSIDVIVSEGYLGHPLQGNEPSSFLQKQKREVEDLWEHALHACAKLQSPGKRLVCIWPSYATKNGSVDIDLTPRLAATGYQLINTPLLYGRAEQHVKRQVVVLEKV